MKKESWRPEIKIVAFTGYGYHDGRRAKFGKVVGRMADTVMSPMIFKLLKGLRIFGVISLSALVLTFTKSCLAGNWENIGVLTDLLQAALDEKAKVEDGSYRIVPLDSRLRLGKCQNKPKISFPGNQGRSLRVSCQSPDWQVTARYTGNRFISVVVTSHFVGRGKKLARSDLILTRKPSNLIGNDVLTSIEKAIGKFTIMSLRQGSLVPNSVLRSSNHLASEIVTPRKRKLKTIPKPIVKNKQDLKIYLVFARRPIKKGEYFSDSNTKISNSYKEVNIWGVFRSVDDVLGLVAKRNLDANNPIRMTDVGPPNVIDRGDIVKVVSQGKGFTVTVGAVAADAGPIGSRVSVVNPSTGVRFRGTVFKAGHVALSPL